MPHLISIFLCSAMLALSSGCGSSAAHACERADECNLLSGTNVDECTEQTEKALEDLTEAQRNDAEKALDDCDELESCDNYANCIGLRLIVRN